MRKGASSSAALHRALAPFVDAVQQAPHRDAAHVPYGHWFRLYVQLLRALSPHQQQHRLQQQQRSMGGQGRGNAEAVSVHPGAAMLAEAKRAVDAALWSSLLAEHWSQVLVPGQGSSSFPASDAASTSTLWYAGAQSASCAQRYAASFTNHVLSSSNPSCTADHEADTWSVGSSVELLSPGFLAEPLTGGAALAAWTAELRRMAAELSAQQHTTGGDTLSEEETAPVPTFHVCLPFSTLFQLKYDAHLRTGSSSISSRGAGHPPALSLQERRARQVLLQSLHQTLQVQADLDSAFPAHVSSRFLLRLHAWAPTDEFDMLCALPRLRPVLLADAAAARQAGGGSDPEKLLSLELLCESAPARMAFLTRHAALQSAQQAAAAAAAASTTPAVAAKGQQPVPVALLSHSSELRTLRALGVPAVRDRSTFLAWRRRLAHVAERAGDSAAAFSLAGAGGIDSSTRHPAASPAHAAHQQAWRGCAEMIRRMTRREENIRQSFSQH